MVRGFLGLFDRLRDGSQLLEGDLFHGETIRIEKRCLFDRENPRMRELCDPVSIAYLVCR